MSEGGSFFSSASKTDVAGPLTPESFERAFKAIRESGAALARSMLVVPAGMVRDAKRKLPALRDREAWTEGELAATTRLRVLKRRVLRRELDGLRWRISFWSTFHRG